MYKELIYFNLINFVFLKNEIKENYKIKKKNFFSIKIKKRQA